MCFEDIIANVAKCSKANEVIVTLNYRESIFLVSGQDNGGGFEDANPEGMGLSNIRHRIKKTKGRFEIQSPPAGATDDRLDDRETAVLDYMA